MAGLPPVARLAVVFVAGSALMHPGARFLAPLLVLLIAAPIRASHRPDLRAIWLLTAVAGAAAGLFGGHTARQCDLGAHDGAEVTVTGRLLAEGGRTLPFEVEAPGGCRVTIRIQGEDIELGRVVTLSGRWRAWSGGFILEVASSEFYDVPDGDDGGWDPRGRLVRWRGHLVRRLHVLYPNYGGVVAALVLARKEGLDPEIREAFARTGTAHLLAISGFHVGVVAGLLLLAFRMAGAPRRRAGLFAAGGAWTYVAFIGFPSAACRAALILATVALSRARGRPPARFGALGVALLALVVWDPGSLTGAGFQLSFAGAGALVLWGSRIAAVLDSWSGGRIPRSVLTAVGAGVAATAGTLPIVAWHFERVSLVGIPATLLVSPLVVLALPGALASLALDLVSPVLGGFVAGGVGLLLAALTTSIQWLAGYSWTSVWITRSWVVVGAAGWCIGLSLAGSTRIRARVRRGVALLMALGAVVGWPLLQGLERRGTLELVMLDVGQGDAMAIRTPRGRWILIDAGPPGRSPDPGGNPAVRALRRRGVSGLELMVLTHPDLDHIGGAGAVLRSFPVAQVLDPGFPAGKGPYVELLQIADEEGVPWLIAEAGQRFELDGMSLEVLHPDPGGSTTGGSLTANDVSVVLRVRYGDFDALLTGDAPASVERGIAEAMTGGIEVLKVGHHGSDTSTDSVFVARAAPQAALISVGRGNRYGHPTPAVLARLESMGLKIYRTDQQGTLTLHARPDGRFTIEVAGTGRR